LTSPNTPAKIHIGPVESSGKNEKARRTMENVIATENGLPDSRTPLAICGQPAKINTESRMRENTCDVVGSREARTTDAERAEVREREEVRLGSAVDLAIPSSLADADFRIRPNVEMQEGGRHTFSPPARYPSRPHGLRFPSVFSPRVTVSPAYVDVGPRQ